jgi:hypothetical protein
MPAYRDESGRNKWGEDMKMRWDRNNRRDRRERGTGRE